MLKTSNNPRDIPPIFLGRLIDWEKQFNILCSENTFKTTGGVREKVLSDGCLPEKDINTRPEPFTRLSRALTWYHQLSNDLRPSGARGQSLVCDFPDPQLNLV